jgi:hypothetical protein
VPGKGRLFKQKKEPRVFAIRWPRKVKTQLGLNSQAKVSLGSKYICPSLGQKKRATQRASYWGLWFIFPFNGANFDKGAKAPL